MSLVDFAVIVLGISVMCITGSRDANRLYDDLMSDYNKLVRPVNNNSHKVWIKIDLKLTQLIDINLKQQVMTTNIWLKQEWEDYQLKWDPNDYAGVDMLHVPAESLWLPDIVLFNNADGNYEVILMNKATVYSSGKVKWIPPALYKSACEIDVEFFPFDIQTCLMKFGSWTYDGMEVDLKHVKQKPDSTRVETGIDMSEFYKSVEWDLLHVPARYNNEFYDCCEEPFPDITFNITMRRKTLFYTVNLIIPCVGISFLTVLVFYLPSDSGEKVTLSISILVALTVFFLLLAEIIPPTSLAVPLLGKYLLFTMILVTFSICTTVGVINVHHRSPSTHRMSEWVRQFFTRILPRFLLIKRPLYVPGEELSDVKYDFYGMNRVGCNSVEIRRESFFRSMSSRETSATTSHHTLQLGSTIRATIDDVPHQRDDSPASEYTAHFRPYSSELQKAIESILFIAEHMRKEDEDECERQDWKFVAMVLDRFFLWLFTLACFMGTGGIIFQAPSLYDSREPIDVKMSHIGLALDKMSPAVVGKSIDSGKIYLQLHAALMSLNKILPSINMRSISNAPDSSVAAN